MEARLDDVAYIDGMEEAAHSVYRWNRPSMRGNTGGGTQTMSMTEYDSTPVEYHGLGWRIRGVMDATDIPPDIKERILTHLKQRMDNAIAYRNAQKSNK